MTKAFDPGGQAHVVVQVVEDAPNGHELPTPPAEPVRPQQLTPEELRRGEADIIEDLFRSDAESKQRVATLEIKRMRVRQFDGDGRLVRDEHGEVVMGPLRLHLRALRQSQLDEARRKCGRIWQLDEQGVRVNTFDPTELSARIVTMALVPEERERYLEDRRMWDHFGAGGPIDLLDKWLQAGELAQAGGLVMQLSGIRMDPAFERLVSEHSSEAEAD